jgi:hypothetical protein
MVLSIAAGQTLKDEMNAFMYAIGRLLTEVDKGSFEPNWFMEGIAGNSSTGSVLSVNQLGPKHPPPARFELQDSGPKDNALQEDEPQDRDQQDGEPPEDEPQQKEPLPSSTLLKKGTRDELPSSSSSEDEVSTADEGPQRRKQRSGPRPLEGKPGNKRKGRNGQRKTRLPQGPLRVPDLPVVDKANQKPSNPPIRVVHEDKSLEVGVKATLYRGVSSSDPLEYEFKAWKGTVSYQHARLHIPNPSFR